MDYCKRPYDECHVNSRIKERPTKSQSVYGGGDTLKHRKLIFDEFQNVDEDLLQGRSFTSHRSVNIRPSEFVKGYRSFSTLSLKSSNDFMFICDWYPELFGIDEDFIPSSEDDEGWFDDILNEELEEKAEALTESELSLLRVGSREQYTDEELKQAWKKDQIPRYGRRARQKPILERENNEKFECICDIDSSYSRHYIPHFGGGVIREGEELQTPHFTAFWEEFREKATVSASDDWSKIFEKETEAEEDKSQPYRPLPQFPGSTKKKIKEFRQALYRNFRPLNCREVRRYRMPFAEALYLELQEDRYFESAFFFKNLIIKDFYAHQGFRSQGPPLRQTKSRMEKLVKFLKIAERFSRRKEYHKEAMIFLKSGKYFNDHDESWWWLAEEFYKKAVRVSQKSIIDGGKSEALSRYIFGVFLLDYVGKVQEAQKHLLKAREISLGKDWNAGRILNKKQNPIHRECVNYLCRALIAASKELRKNGKPEEALPLIHQSYKLCRESEPVREIEMETYFELGLTYQELGMLDWAKLAFRKFIEISKVENYPRRVCDGYLELAICYRSEGDMTRCHYNLISYLENAENNEDENLKAFGHRYLGEFHLNNGNSETAAELFRTAFESFCKQRKESLKIPFNEWKPEHFTLPHDVELARVLVGLAEGEMLTKPICQLILQARDARNHNEILKLINWKNKKEISFEPEDSVSEAPSYVADPDNTQFQLNPALSTYKELEVLGEVSDFRTVRFAVDDTKPAIIL